MIKKMKENTNVGCVTEATEWFDRLCAGMPVIRR